MASLRVIGIVGTAYCGSTAFGMSLGSHPDACFVGEVGQAVEGCYLPTPPTQDMINWHQAAFGRPSPYSGSVLCHECGDGCPIWRPDEYPLNPYTAHQELAARLGTSVLVDSTKYTKSFRLFEEAPLSWCYVLLIKTPERQLASYRRNINHVGSPAASDYCLEYGWALDFLRGRSFIVSDYTEFATYPSVVLDRVAELAGLSPGRVSPVNYRNRTHHQISGNWCASQAKAPIHVDETWIDFRSEIDPQDLSRMYNTYREVTGHAPSSK